MNVYPKEFMNLFKLTNLPANQIDLVYQGWKLSREKFIISKEEVQDNLNDFLDKWVNDYKINEKDLLIELLKITIDNNPSIAYSSISELEDIYKNDFADMEGDYE